MAERTLTQRQVSEEMGRLITKGAVYCVLIGVVATVQVFRVGWVSDWPLLLISAVGSVPALFVYSMVSLSGGRRGLFWALLPFAGFVPFLLGCYLVFVQGLWGLSRGLSVWVALRTVGVVVVGYGLVHATYRLTEFVQNLRNGSITVER